MFLKTIYEHADSLAPFALSREYHDKYGFYDNSGVMLDCGEEITGALFSLDLSEAAIAKAKELGMNCIFTHHPAIYGPLHSLKSGGEGKEILQCAKAGISVISAHLNLDAAKGGIDDSLMQGLGGKEAEHTMHTFSAGGYGKVYTVAEKEFGTFLKETAERFQAERIVSYGSGKVKKVASFCGGGMDDSTVRFAIESGVDTFVSSDGKHHLVKELTEYGVKIVLLTHFAAENYGFARFYENMKKLLKGDVDTVFFTDGRYL